MKIKPKTKAVFLKLSPKEHKDLTAYKMNFCSFYGCSFKWEDYVLAIAKLYDERLKEVRVEDGNE